MYNRVKAEAIKFYLVHNDIQLASDCGKRQGCYYWDEPNPNTERKQTMQEEEEQEEQKDDRRGGEGSEQRNKAMTFHDQFVLFVVVYWNPKVHNSIVRHPMYFVCVFFFSIYFEGGAELRW